jgi:CHASE2 domain-containing sensor protein
MIFGFIKKWMLGHHLVVALILALGISVLDSYGWLNQIENDSLRIVAAMQEYLPTTSVMAKSGSLEDPVVVAISPQLYEGLFTQTSPLNRDRLLELLEPIINEKPALVVIDLDLSPGVGGNSRLDELLRYSNQQSERLLLAAPFPVTYLPLIEAKYEWMWSMCNPPKATPIRFAYPGLPIAKGMNLRYFQGRHTLAEESCRLLHGENCSHSTSRPAALSDDSPCALVSKGRNSATFLDSIANEKAPEHSQSGHYRSQVHIDPTILRTTAANIVLLEALPLNLPRLTNRIVFVGGAYDPADRFLTVAGYQPGVVIHAAAYKTMLAGTKEIPHSYGLLADIIFGILAGIGFHSSWERYNRSSLRFQMQRSSVSCWLVARGWLLLNFVLLAGTVILLFWLSAFLMEKHMWGNPGPVVIGVFIKSLLGSRVHLHRQMVEVEPTLNTESLGTSWVGYLDSLIIGLPIAIFFIFSLQSH